MSLKFSAVESQDTRVDNLTAQIPVTIEKVTFPASRYFYKMICLSLGV